MVKIQQKFPADPDGRWQVDVVKTVAVSGEGVKDLRSQIEAHHTWLRQSGELVLREQLRIAHTLEHIIRTELNRRIAATMPADGLDEMVEAVRRREPDPYQAADGLLAQL